MLPLYKTSELGRGGIDLETMRMKALAIRADLMLSRSDDKLLFRDWLHNAGLNEHHARMFEVLAETSCPSIWLTCDLASAFPAEAWHVTTTLAAAQICQGYSLGPSLSGLDFYDEYPVPMTGKGVWLQMQRPLRGFVRNDEIYELAACSFCGRLPDPQMVAFQDRLAVQFSSIQAYDAAVLALFIQEEAAQLSNIPAWRLHPSATITNILNTAAGSEDRDAPVDLFCKELYNLTQLREGWLDDVRERFKWVTIEDYQIFLLKLANVFINYVNNLPPERSFASGGTQQMPQAAVLRLNPRVAMRHMFGDGPYPVVVSDRPPSEFVILPYIPHVAVTGIGHSGDGTALVTKFNYDHGFDQSSLSSLETWLGGVLPSGVSLSYGAEPVMARSYNVPTTTWAQLACAGKLAPVYGFKPVRWPTEGINRVWASELEGTDGIRRGIDKAQEIFGTNAVFSDDLVVEGVFDREYP